MKKTEDCFALLDGQQRLTTTAVLLGDGITLTDYAALGHLNRNECTVIIGKRVPRIYV